MVQDLKIAFAAFGAGTEETLVVMVGADLALREETKTILGAAPGQIAKAAAHEGFKAKAGSSLTILAPSIDGVTKLVVMGTAADEKVPLDPVNLGGSTMAQLGSKSATVCFTLGSDAKLEAEAAADFAMGAAMRAYSFDRYKTKKADGDNKDEKTRTLTIQVADPAAARKAFKSRQGLADGINVARDLVNEPPNVLYPVTFAERAASLEKLGVDVEILDEKQLKKLGMRTLLAVGQGSERESRVVIMRWNGAKDEKAPPLAFVGKGVCFDTGGISIKPAGSMEDMKGDMAGAACVVGLMHALAARKAKVNVVGAIGLVENMPDGNAQRPGDIVTSMSGQTIEIINTDAEGRLVLADVLWHVQGKYKPVFMVDLATLTGAILVALGSEHAGLFSNDDTLAERLHKAGIATGEKVWRMPLTAEYDKLMDSKVADVKNAGARNAGSITAAQFLKRFVNDCPWAHLDIAGTGMGSPATAINQSWGSGWGVRLLDRLVSEYYE